MSDRELLTSGCITCRWFDTSVMLDEQDKGSDKAGEKRQVCLNIYSCAVAEDTERPTEVRNDAADYMLDSGDGCPYREVWNPNDLHHVFDDEGDAYTRRFGIEWKYDKEELVEGKGQGSVIDVEMLPVEEDDDDDTSGDGGLKLIYDSDDDDFEVFEDE